MERLKFVNCTTQPELSISGTSSSCSYTYEYYDVSKDIQDIGLGIIEFLVLIFFYLLPYIVLFTVLNRITKKNKIKDIKTGEIKQN